MVWVASWQQRDLTNPAIIDVLNIRMLARIRRKFNRTDASDAKNDCGQGVLGECNV